MKILIVAVNYNSYEQLQTFLESVRVSTRFCKEGVDVEVAVADNSTNKEEIKCIEDNVIHLSVYPLDNLGYFGGAQQIINNIENKGMYDYIAISNVDLKLNEDFFETLFHYRCSDEIGWIAPSVYSLQEKRDKKTLFRPSKIKFRFLCLIFKYPILFKLYRQLFYSRKRQSADLGGPRIVYSGHGAFFLLTKNFFRKIHELEFKPFLFCEENYVAELLRENSLKCIYEPSLKIWDEEHVSTGKMNYKRRCLYNYEAHKYIYDRFYR